MFPDKVYLASKSPRRLELLRAAFKSVSVLQAPVEEPRWHTRESAEDYLDRCIQVKAEAAKIAFGQHVTASGWSLLVAADTIVVLGRTIFGKPENPEAAFEMLSTLMGQTHRVLTSLYLGLSKEGLFKDDHIETVETRVTFRRASKDEIWKYVRTKEPMDKSGSYGVQGPALQFIEKIDGSYASVMGLPVAQISAKANAWEAEFLSQ